MDVIVSGLESLGMVVVTVVAGIVAMLVALWALIVLSDIKRGTGQLYRRWTGEIERWPMDRRGERVPPHTAQLAIKFWLLTGMLTFTVLVGFGLHGWFG